MDIQPLLSGSLREGSGPGENASPLQERVDRLKIFTLNWIDWLSVAEWLGLGLKGLICTIDRQWCYQEIQKHVQPSQVAGPLPNFQAPIICSGIHTPSTSLALVIIRNVGTRFNITCHVSLNKRNKHHLLSTHIRMRLICCISHICHANTSNVQIRPNHLSNKEHEERHYSKLNPCRYCEKYRCVKLLCDWIFIE